MTFFGGVYHVVGRPIYLQFIPDLAMHITYTSLVLGGGLGERRFDKVLTLGGGVQERHHTGDNLGS